MSVDLNNGQPDFPFSSSSSSQLSLIGATSSSPSHLSVPGLVSGKVGSKSSSSTSEYQTFKQKQK